MPLSFVIVSDVRPHWVNSFPTLPSARRRRSSESAKSARPARLERPDRTAPSKSAHVLVIAFQHCFHHQLTLVARVRVVKVVSRADAAGLRRRLMERVQNANAYGCHCQLVRQCPRVCVSLGRKHEPRASARGGALRKNSTFTQRFHHRLTPAARGTDAKSKRVRVPLPACPAVPARKCEPRAQT